MAAPRVQAMREVPIDKADTQQLVDFASLGLGLKFGGVPSRDQVISQLRSLGKETIWLADVEMPDMPAAAPEQHQEREDRTDPATEEWVQITVDPAIDISTGQRIDDTVDLAVNERSVSLPRGIPVWCAEIFYVHLKQSCVYRRLAQEPKRPDGRAGQVNRFNEGRFSVHFHKYGGVLKDNPTPKGWRRGERVYGPDGHVPPEVIMSHRQLADDRVQGNIGTV